LKPETPSGTLPRGATGCWPPGKDARHVAARLLHKAATKLDTLDLSWWSAASCGRWSPPGSPSSSRTPWCWPGGTTRRTIRCASAPPRRTASAPPVAASPWLVRPRDL